MYVCTMKANKKVVTPDSIASQITVLERKMAECVVDGKPTKTAFAIGGKIKKLEKQRQELIYQNWLGQ